MATSLNELWIFLLEVRDRFDQFDSLSDKVAYEFGDEYVATGRYAEDLARLRQMDVVSPVGDSPDGTNVWKLTRKGLGE